MKKIENGEIYFTISKAEFKVRVLLNYYMRMDVHQLTINLNLKKSLQLYTFHSLLRLTDLFPETEKKAKIQKLKWLSDSSNKASFYQRKMENETLSHSSLFFSNFCFLKLSI